GHLHLSCLATSFSIHPRRTTRHAERVYSVDQVPSRLELASSIATVPISFNTSDPVAQVITLEPNGVTRALDCVGFELSSASKEALPSLMFTLVDRIAPGELRWPTRFLPKLLYHRILVGESPGRGKRIVLPLDHAQALIDLIAAGRATPSFVVSSIIDIEQVPKHYRRYSDLNTRL
ncbi:hypothetical protein ETB97_009753, partial [Aspergillus alliaceus]